MRGRKLRGWKLQSHREEGVAKKMPRTERSDCVLDTEDRVEVGHLNRNPIAI